MDFDLSEQAVAAMLAEEASQLRRAAGFQGYSAFLQKPVVRARPNNNFLAATVRGVESSNRMAQVSDMWQLRKKELSEEEGSGDKASGIRNRTRDGGKYSGQDRNRSRLSSNPEAQIGKKEVEQPARSEGLAVGRDCSSSESPSEEERGAHGQFEDRAQKRGRWEGERTSEITRHLSSDGGKSMGPQVLGGDDDGDAQDLELDEFLHSRRKRGRGEVGSRMDEPGPFAAAQETGDLDDRAASSRPPVVVGPQLPAELEKHWRRDRRLEVSQAVVEETLFSKKRKHRTKEEKRARKEGRRKRREEKERSGKKLRRSSRQA